MSGLAQIDSILRHLRATRADLTDEKRTQADLAAALGQAIADPPVEREVRLGKHDVIDIVVGDIGIEVKLKGASKRDIWRQLERYAAHDRIAGLVLASNLSMGLPQSVMGKPVWFVALGRAWL